MLARLWRGRVAVADADDYIEYQRQVGPPGYRAIAGNRGILMLGRQLGPEYEIAMLTFWRSRSAVAGFAGDNLDRARYYERDLDYLIDPPEGVTHYRVTACEGKAGVAAVACLRRGHVEAKRAEQLLRERARDLTAYRALPDAAGVYLLDRPLEDRHEITTVFLRSSSAGDCALDAYSTDTEHVATRGSSQPLGRPRVRAWYEEFQVLELDPIRPDAITPSVSGVPRSAASFASPRPG